MESQSKEPSGPSPGTVPSRTHFHIVLGMIVIPYASTAVGWVLALLDVIRGYGSKAQLYWSRALVGLVLVDTLVAMASIWMIGHKQDILEASAAQAGPKSYVGIRFEPTDPGGEPVIDTTAPGFGAEKAGLRKGDRILAIDGKPVRTQQDAIDALIHEPPDTTRKFRLRRGDEELDADVVSSAYPRFEFFQVVYSVRNRPWFPDLRGLLPAFLCGAAAWVWARWRWRDRGRIWLAILLAILGTSLVSFVGALLIDRAVGGISVGGALLSQTVHAWALLGAGLLLRRIFPGPRPPPGEEPRGSVLGTYFLGAYYLFTSATRITVLLFVANVIWFGGKGSSDPILQLVQAGNLGVLGTLLLIFDTVVLAPIGEELLFRGVLLPRLSAQKGSGWAIGVSAVFFAVLHWPYGVYVPLIAVYGVILGWARVRSGGLIAPILLHLSINAVVTATMLSR